MGRKVASNCVCVCNLCLCEMIVSLKNAYSSTLLSRIPLIQFLSARRVISKAIIIKDKCFMSLQ